MRPLVVVLVLLAGCAAPEIPREERLPAPRPCWTRRPLRGGGDLVARVHAPPPWQTAEELVELLRIALPEQAWGEGTSLEARGGAVSIVADAATQERADELVLANASSGTVHLDVTVYDVPASVADTLGPLERSASSGDDVPFLRAPLSAAARQRIESLVAAGEARRTGGFDATGRHGQWLRGSSAQHRSLIETVTFGGGLASPVVGARELGVRVAACLVRAPREGDAAAPPEFLVAFHCEEEEPLLDGRAFTCRAHDDNTAVALDASAWVRRSTTDCAVLAPGESLALISGGTATGRARVIVLAPIH